ncbi:hypothetical protein HDU78_002248 [Chytriomyces hyalinus]|nr:hypothetical protein HDU78_002248 [Chytriomyces hyalinus]
MKTGLVTAAVALLAGSLYTQRNRLFALVAYIVAVELPRQYVVRLLRRTRLDGLMGAWKVNHNESSLDAISAALIAATHAATSARCKDTREMRDIASGMCSVDAAVARVHGAIISPYSFLSTSPHLSVNGVWIAQSQVDIPASSGACHPDLIVLLYVHGARVRAPALTSLLISVFSGGGFVLNTAEAWALHHFLLVQAFNNLEISKKSPKRLVIFSLEYPLAPESPYPSALNSALQAFEWLSTVVKAQSILVGGDSAGGHCVIQLLNKIAADARLSALPVQPTASILYSPWVDPFCTVILDETVDVFDISNDEFTLSLAHAMRGECMPESPEMNLLLLEPSKIVVAPKGTLVVYGGAERLACAIERFVGMVRSANPDYKLQVLCEPYMCHTYNLMLTSYPGMGKDRSMAAVDKAAQFIHEAVVE